MNEGTDVDVGSNADQTGLPSLEQMVMPGTRINRARHANSEQARHALELTNNIITSKLRMGTDDEEHDRDGDEPGKSDPLALLPDRIDSLTYEQRKCLRLSDLTYSEGYSRNELSFYVLERLGRHT